MRQIGSGRNIVTEERALNGRSGEGVVTVRTPVAARSHGSKLRRRSRARFVWLIVFLLVLALPSVVRAAATTLYVDKGNPNCSDAGSGTATQPFCTISAAASRVVAGQTVQVSSGTYNEQVTVSTSGTASAPISFVVAPNATVTISGGVVHGFDIVGRSYVTVQGFNITQTSGDGIVVKNSSHITIRANRSSFCGQPTNGQTAKGIRLENSFDRLDGRGQHG
jgi:hypothetical protein